MVTATTSMYELSRFHEMVVLMHADVEDPIISVRSAAGEWRADIRLSGFEVINGELDALDAMSIKEWWLLRRDDIEDAWNQIEGGKSPKPIEPLPENWPIGGPAPIRAISVKPLEGYRLWVQWENGYAGELDLAFLADHPAFGPWQDPRKFESVQIIGSSFTWGEDMEVCAWLNCWPDLAEPTDNKTDSTVQ